MPLASFADTVIVDAVEPSAVTDDGEEPTVDCAAVAAPDVKVTDADSVIKVPEALVPMYARTTTEPDVVDFTVAVTTPEEFVDHGPELRVPVPEEIAKNTSWLATTLLLTSFAVTMIVDAAEPSAVTEAGEAPTVDCAAVAAPTWVVSDGDVPLKLEVSVPVIVRVSPAVVGTVYTTDATPLAFVVDVGEANEPPVPLAVHVIVRPVTPTSLPFASCA